MDPESEIGIVHFGLGPIGIEIARLAGERAALRSVGAIDISPALVGRRLADLTQMVSQAGVEVTDKPAAALGAPGANVVVHSTASSLAVVLPQLLEAIEAGLSVVSTCEELSWPWAAAPDAARQLDGAARSRGVVVLGTGVNPGFAMDYLPIVLSGASRRVDRVVVHRVQDAGVRRLPLQRKVGAGLSVAEFEERAAVGTVRHVGLPESVAALAAAFGWHLTELQDEIHPVIAEVPTPSGLGVIAPGDVTGVRQTARGMLGKAEVVRLTLEMAVGIAHPRDEVELHGDPDVQMVIPGGLHGDIATASVVVNSIERILTAAPGLRVMADLAPPRPSARRPA